MSTWLPLSLIYLFLWWVSLYAASFLPLGFPRPCTVCGCPPCPWPTLSPPPRGGPPDPTQLLSLPTRLPFHRDARKRRGGWDRRRHREGRREARREGKGGEKVRRGFIAWVPTVIVLGGWGWYYSPLRGGQTGVEGLVPWPECPIQWTGAIEAHLGFQVQFTHHHIACVLLLFQGQVGSPRNEKLLLRLKCDQKESSCNNRNVPWLWILKRSWWPLKLPSKK